MFGLGGEVEFSGSTNTFNGMNVGQRIRLSGSHSTFSFDSALCATPTPTSSPTATSTPTDTSTPTVTATPTDTATPTPTPLPIIEVIAGQPGQCGYQEGPASESLLCDPHGVFDTRTANSLYFADTGNHVVRKIDGQDIVSTVAGTGVAGYNGDGIKATSAQLNGPRDVFVDGDGNVYIADTENCRVRKVSGGTISTVAGDGTCGYGGDGGPATAAQLNRPSGVAVDEAGTIYIADTENCRIRRVLVGGTIETIAGSGECGFGGDGGASVLALLNRPHDLYFFTSGKDLLIADTDNHRIRRLATMARTISTFAGTGTPGYSGDDGPALDAELNGPEAVAATPDFVFIADTRNHAIRRVDAATGIITTIVGDGTAGTGLYGGPGIAAHLRFPAGVGIGSVTVADTGNDVLLLSGEAAGGPPGRNRFVPTVSCDTGAASLDWALPTLFLGLILGRKRLGALFFRRLGALRAARSGG